jgi:para-aminobenzoate synthetase/4-amino-4-deoxychorismate lyase
VLVREGEPRDLDRHLARHAASARALYGRTLEVNVLGAAARERCAGAGDARLRLRTTPQAGTRLELDTLPAPVDRVRLAPVVLAGGLGAHKWADRRLVEALTAELGAIPLLVDTSGDVLEAAWASVLARVDGIWRTPPADGRILPGIARSRLLAAGAAVEAPLTLDDLRRADRLRVVSALRAVDAAL